MKAINIVYDVNISMQYFTPGGNVNGDHYG